MLNALLKLNFRIFFYENVYTKDVIPKHRAVNYLF